MRGDVICSSCSRGTCREVCEVLGTTRGKLERYIEHVKTGRRNVRTTNENAKDAAACDLPQLEVHRRILGVSIAALYHSERAKLLAWGISERLVELSCDSGLEGFPILLIIGVAQHTLKAQVNLAHLLCLQE